MRKFSYLLIAAGVLVMLYPWGNERYNDWQQAKLLAKAEQSLAEASPAPADSLIDSDLQSKYAAVSQILEDGEGTDAQEPAQTEADDKAIGIIEIPSIDVKLPILEGATKANMKHAAAHLTGTAPLGGEGNSAIAAHRAHTKGRLFNRLGEMKLGDAITVKTQGQTFQYEVVEVLRVKPTDISVLEKRGKGQMLTLITCDPLVNPTHRLIIHAKIP